MDYTGVRRKGDLTRGIIRLAMQSVSNLAIIPLQDWLELGNDARINTPATVGGINWRWRAQKSAFSRRLNKNIAEMTHLYGRHGGFAAIDD
jgi:4-alpha-glucanotransferase